MSLFTGTSISSTTTITTTSAYAGTDRGVGSSSVTKSRSLPSKPMLSNRLSVPFILVSVRGAFALALLLGGEGGAAGGDGVFLFVLVGVGVGVRGRGEVGVVLGVKSYRRSWACARCWERCRWWLLHIWLAVRWVSSVGEGIDVLVYGFAAGGGVH